MRVVGWSSLGVWKGIMMPGNRGSSGSTGMLLSSKLGG